ncbi:MAG TPA: ribonuclease P protein component [Bdellovibrionales bacterium]|nr:ribonuclease P protein component [Bdellovibrionales bacterium]
MENKFRLRSLTRRADFERLRTEGKSVHINSWLLVNMQPTESGEVRCGWTIPRQVGTAVVRNRLRRWGREYLRRWGSGLKRGLDVNLVIRRRDKEFYKLMAHKEFNEAMDKMAARLERYLN